ncbi:accessory Sec system protein Asp1 [Weissella coleopterorum]|uniref:Accessory Sec system protein Asp1 n=1 Tax=Weissella coleopterorum TaxID=2714949 RepID=A0A6G8AZQ8_9LACO|nr:accessory Sec system protein Asp1 [Weissella coleopterorum]QIL50445.1 accessory Sec system protein Asp1 [Weissella coleopterorum]
MITFIPAWRGETTNNVSSDDLIGQIKAFMFSDTEYQILVSNYMPNLRYFLHKYGLLESNYWNLFDELQGFSEVSQRKIEISDLRLDKNLSYFYTPFNILGYRNGKKIVAIRVGDAGQVAEVFHYQNEVLKLVDVYDDRGILSSQKEFTNGQLHVTKYLDKNGIWIFQERAKDGEIQVNVVHPHGLSLKRYETLGKLRQELIEARLQKLSSDDQIIISVTDQNVNFLRKTAFIKQMTLSIFRDRLSLAQKDSKRVSDLVKNAHNVIVDRRKTFDDVVEVLGHQDNIYQISPYDTRFKLGISNELKEEIIYFDSANITELTFKTAMQEMIEFIIKEKGIDNSKREFKIIIRHLNGSEIKLKGIVGGIFNEMYPDEYELISQLSPKAGENTLDETVVEALDEKVQVIMQTMNQIEFFTLNSDDELFKILEGARLIIDMSDDPDLFTQIAAISAGIPQINSVDNEYVLDQKNGLILPSITELKNGLSYYLNELKHWQEAQVYAAKQIKKYSGNELKKQLLQIVAGQDNG